MYTTLWASVAVAIAVILATYSRQLYLEIFPFHLLTAHKHSEPQVVTKSFAGRTVLVTGAHGAYGSRAARLFKEADTLILVDLLDCTSLKDEIEEELGSAKKPKILVWQVDMMSYASCQELGRKVRELRSLDHALLTAGILSFNRRDSPEGWETSIQVNYLSSALLGLLILPALKSSPSNPNPPVMTFVTSFGVYPASPTMSAPWSGSYLQKVNKSWFGMQEQQYGKSKILLLYFARELAARITAAQAKGKSVSAVTINSADPGPAWTPLTQPNQKKLIPRLIQNYGSRDAKYGAAALVNGVSVDGSGHGLILTDEKQALPIPPFIESRSGAQKQRWVWDETREEFESKVPDVKAIYAMLETS